MSGQDYDRIIAQERKVLVSINEHGDKLLAEFKQTTALYIHDWSIQLMKRYLTNNPEITKKLGPQQSEELKRDFKELLAAFPELTAKRLDDPKIWLHRIKIPEKELQDLTYSYQLEKRSKKWINQAIRELIGLVGSLLISYGFIDLKNEYEWEMKAGNVLQYAYDIPTRNNEHFQALNKLLERYKNILIEYVYASQSLWKAEQGKKAAEGG